jgi:hypothetical protein
MMLNRLYVRRYSSTHMRKNRKDKKPLDTSIMIGYCRKLSVKRENYILAYISGAATLVGGILHLMMVGPSLKPANFPMQLLPYTDTLFVIAGLAQIFWTIPMIKGWGIRWYYFGILGTIALTMLLILSRVPNEITGTALHDTNPMAQLTEISQFLYIGATAIIVARKKLSFSIHQYF